MEYLFEQLTLNYAAEAIRIFNYHIENGFAAYPEEPVSVEFWSFFIKASKGYPTMLITDRTNTKFSKYDGFSTNIPSVRHQKDKI